MAAKCCDLQVPQQVVPMKGEKNYLVYIPLGVGVVIPPWNFPANSPLLLA